MKKQQRPASTARKPHGTDTSQISIADSPPARNGAPPGTVASRVQFLQSLQKSSSPWSGPAPNPTPATSTRRRENSRTGFGRRLTNRFGLPALQSAQPYEEARADTSHSFLGLNTPRNSHVEEHGYADSRIRYSKSPGISGMVALVAQERTQLDAVAPWRGLSRSKSSRSMGRRQEGNDMDGHRSGLADHGHIVAEATILSLTAGEDDLHAFHRGYRSHEADTMKSENSFATTSTIRRQSVRDLFDDYGIERPEGLVSSIELSRDIEETPRPTRPHRFCHLCSWVNSGPSTKCWRCSHHLCSVCDDQSPQPVTRKKVSLSYSERFMKNKALEKQPSHVLSSEQRRAIEIEPVKQTPYRPGPTPIQKRAEANTSPPRKRSSPPSKFPEFHHEFPPTAKSYQAFHPPKYVPETPAKATDNTSRARVTTSVKDSPFMIADSTAKKQSITLFPFDPRSDNRQTLPSRHEHRLRHQHQHSPSSASSLRCERLNCQATHCKHQHAVLRMKEQENHYLRKEREETENGYVADTSLAEEDVHGHSHIHMQASESSIHTHSTFSRPQSHASRKALHSHQHQLGGTRESCVPEFVECRGYPRTGHIRHGSCSGTELVGECQHCLEDCQCAACQSTHHNVRCCTHKDHKAIVHQHHTPRREFSTPGLHVRPLSTPRKPSIPSSPIAAVRQSPRSANVETLTAHNLEQNLSSKQVLSKQPSLEKVPSIPLTKKSIFIKEASKPPTPPPWVSVPRSSLLRPFQQDPAEEQPNEHIPDFFASLKKTFTSPPVKDWGSTQLDNKNQNNVYEGREGRNAISQRKHSKVKEKGKLSSKDTTRSSSRTKISPPGSRKASRRLPALFQLREKDPVPALTQKLLQHQEEIRSVQETRNERIEAAPPEGVASLARRLEQKKRIPEQGSRKPEPNMRESRMASRAVSTDSTKKWRLRSVDKQPSSPCMNDNNRTLSEHRLEDDRLERTVKKQDRKVMSEARLDTHKRNVDEHECSWKRMTLDVHNGRNSGCNRKEANLGIIGITIILHFDEKEDMILKARSWTTTGEPRVLR
jgi:hypothetical protein